MRDLDRQAATRAEKEGLEPRAFYYSDEVEKLVIKDLPHIGPFIPKGWVKTGGFFVDLTGEGEPFEPAMTREHFLHKIREADPDTGWAVTSAAEHQAFIGQFYLKSHFCIQRYKITQVNTYAPFTKITRQGTSKLTRILKLQLDSLSTVKPVKISPFIHIMFCQNAPSVL